MQIEEKKFKILIADENIHFRDTLASRLRLQGFTVEFSEGGFHLLHQIEKISDICLIIMHENMHDMPAKEIISLIRTNKPKSALPIVFVSKSSNEEDIREVILTGANEYMVKNPNFQPIVERAQKYFNLLKNS